jgi:hypothetical protein
VIGAVLLSLVLVQDPQQSRVPDAALFDDLIRRTNELKAFSAEYRVRVPDTTDVITIRIRYRSPGEMWIAMSMGTVMSIRDGVMDFCASPPTGSAATARIPIGDWFRERRSRVTGTLYTELPQAKRDWPAEVDCGVSLQLKVSPSRTDETENLEFQASCLCPRTALLSWLEIWKKEDGVRFEGDDHLVWTTERGSRLQLSTRTGFLDRIEKQKANGKVVFELKTLDLDPKFDDESFALPEPPPGAEDASAGFGAQMQGIITQSIRAEYYRWIARHVLDQTLEWSPETQLHSRRVFELLHADGINSENEPWISKTKKWIEGLGPYFRDSYARAAAEGEQSRGQVEEKVQEARDKINATLEQMLRSRTAQIDCPETVVSDDGLRSSLLDLEKQAVEHALENFVREPLLEAFDDQVNRAKAGR